ncbi:CvfB family protein [Lacticigenium naphthae]|uniref:CvfB family protein n=1 Tax=Lacticigenium naphthae TaxID=515351 RepID=UPI000413DDAA|nr:S1-like domain-containing RNA-binding protein [Lacticigenium naphthae]
MNQSLGQVITALVTDKNEDDIFAQKEGTTYQIVNVQEKELSLGDTVEGFAYVDQSGRNKLTTKIPTVSQNQYGWGTVVKTRRDLGVFVDIGLEDKDIVVSMDDLPSENKLWPKKGDQLFISIKVDNQDRIWGHLADDVVMKEMTRPATKEMHNKDIEGIAYSTKMIGTFIYIDDGYHGFVHPSEREIEPRLGQQVKGRVIGLREDGTANVSLLPRAHEVIDDDAAMILEYLSRSPGRKMPFTDKSDPEAIKIQFGISKAQFKRALGRLMKSRKINQTKEETWLLDEKEEEKG